MIVHGKVLRKLLTSEHRAFGTPGRLALDNGYLSDTLELPWHNNERGVSCTAAGLDKGRVWHSPSLNRPVVRFDSRNGRHDVLIHNGNFAADTQDLDGDGVPEVSQVHGCTEVGDGYGEILRKDGKTQFGIKGSVPALERLIRTLDTGEAHVVDADGFISGYDEVEIEYAWDGESPER